VKRFAGAILVYIFGVFLIASISYIQERQRFLADIDQRLFAAASNLPAILPEDFHDLARNPEAISNEQDQYNLELMTRHANSGDLTYLYSYVMVDGEIYFTSCNYTADDLKNDQVVTYWTDYPEGAKEYSDAMTADKPIYVTAGDRWGLFRTILVPMKSPAGLPYVAAADMDITVIERSLMRSVLSVVSMSLLLLMIAIPLILAYRKTYSELNSELRVLNRQLQADIDQALILEAELKQATQSANKANEIKGQFLSNMSHELRTPINGISGMNELLLDTELTEEQKEYVELCNQSAQVLLDTVNQILDVAAIEAGGLKVQLQTVHTETFFNGIMTLFAVQIRDKSLDLVLSFSDNVPAEIETDPVNLRKVLINLISNAIKFTYSGGISVAITWQDGQLHGEVRDTGVGIPKEAKRRIFEAFQQVDNSYAREHGGTGLGLPISLQICNIMQGELSLYHSDETGSTFKFYVCVKALTNSSIQSFTTSENQRLFVCSDSLLLRRWVVAELGADNVDVITSSENILSSISDQSCILLDIKLAHEDLLQLVRQAESENKTVILAAWVGHKLPADVVGRVRLLHKPFTKASLAYACQPDTNGSFKRL
jgi:two-component system sensor histidine kinase BarA